MHYYMAIKIAEKLIKEMTPYCERIEVAGSIRRKCKECGDIEIVYIPITRVAFELYLEPLRHYKILKGKPSGSFMQYRLPEGITADLFRATSDNWGLIYAIRTGSAKYSKDVLATGWTMKGYHSKGGILYRGLGRLFIREEKDLFDLIGIPYAEPENRNL